MIHVLTRTVVCVTAPGGGRGPRAGVTTVGRGGVITATTPGLGPGTTGLGARSISGPTGPSTVNWNDETNSSLSKKLFRDMIYQIKMFRVTLLVTWSVVDLLGLQLYIWLIHSK